MVNTGSDDFITAREKVVTTLPKLNDFYFGLIYCSALDWLLASLSSRATPKEVGRQAGQCLHKNVRFLPHKWWAHCAAGIPMAILSGDWRL